MSLEGIQVSGLVNKLHPKGDFKRFLLMKIMIISTREKCMAGMISMLMLLVAATAPSCEALEKGYTKASPNRAISMRITLKEAQKQGLIEGTPDICIGRSSPSGSCCCHGNHETAMCECPDPLVLQAMLKFLKNDQGSQQNASLWNPVVEGSQVSAPTHTTTTAPSWASTTPELTNYEGRSDPLLAHQLVVVGNSLSNGTESLGGCSNPAYLKEKASKITQAMHKCNRLINKEVEDLMDKALRLDLKRPDDFISSIIPVCPTKKTITYPTMGHACRAPQGYAEIHTVHIAQGCNFLNPVAEEHCDWDRIQETWIPQFGCRLKCHQEYQLLKLPTQLAGSSLDICWNHVVIASGCKAILVYDSPHQTDLTEADNDTEAARLVLPTMGNSSGSNVSNVLGQGLNAKITTRSVTLPLPSSENNSILKLSIANSPTVPPNFTSARPSTRVRFGNATTPSSFVTNPTISRSSSGSRRGTSATTQESATSTGISNSLITQGKVTTASGLRNRTSATTQELTTSVRVSRSSITPGRFTTAKPIGSSTNNQSSAFTTSHASTMLSPASEPPNSRETTIMDLNTTISILGSMSTIDGNSRTSPPAPTQGVTSHSDSLTGITVGTITDKASTSSIPSTPSTNPSASTFVENPFPSSAIPATSSNGAISTETKATSSTGGSPTTSVPDILTSGFLSMSETTISNSNSTNTGIDPSATFFSDSTMHVTGVVASSMEGQSSTNPLTQIPFSSTSSNPLPANNSIETTPPTTQSVLVTISSSVSDLTRTASTVIDQSSVASPVTATIGEDPYTSLLPISESTILSKESTLGLGQTSTPSNPIAVPLETQFTSETATTHVELTSQTHLTSTSSNLDTSETSSRKYSLSTPVRYIPVDTFTSHTYANTLNSDDLETATTTTEETATSNNSGTLDNSYSLSEFFTSNQDQSSTQDITSNSATIRGSSSSFELPMTTAKNEVTTSTGMDKSEDPSTSSSLPIGESTVFIQYFTMETSQASTSSSPEAVQAYSTTEGVATTENKLTSDTISMYASPDPNTLGTSSSNEFLSILTTIDAPLTDDTAAVDNSNSGNQGTQNISTEEMATIYESDKLSTSYTLPELYTGNPNQHSTLQIDSSSITIGSSSLSEATQVTMPSNNNTIGASSPSFEIYTTTTDNQVKASTQIEEFEDPSTPSLPEVESTILYQHSTIGFAETEISSSPEPGKAYSTIDGGALTENETNSKYASRDPYPSETDYRNDYSSVEGTTPDDPFTDITQVETSNLDDLGREITPTGEIVTPNESSTFGLSSSLSEFNTDYEGQSSTYQQTTLSSSADEIVVWDEVTKYALTSNDTLRESSSSYETWVPSMTSSQMKTSTGIDVSGDPLKSSLPEVEQTTFYQDYTADAAEASSSIDPETLEASSTASTNWELTSDTNLMYATGEPNATETTTIKESLSMPNSSAYVPATEYTDVNTSNSNNPPTDSTHLGDVATPNESTTSSYSSSHLPGFSTGYQNQFYTELINSSSGTGVNGSTKDVLIDNPTTSNTIGGSSQSGGSWAAMSYSNGTVSIATDQTSAMNQQNATSTEQTSNLETARSTSSDVTLTSRIDITLASVEYESTSDPTSRNDETTASNPNYLGATRSENYMEDSSPYESISSNEDESSVQTSTSRIGEIISSTNSSSTDESTSDKSSSDESSTVHQDEYATAAEVTPTPETEQNSSTAVSGETDGYPADGSYTDDSSSSGQDESSTEANATEEWSSSEEDLFSTEETYSSSDNAEDTPSTDFSDTMENTSEEMSTEDYE